MIIKAIYVVSEADMKRFLVFFALLCMFFLGLALGVPNQDTAGAQLQHQLNEFEKEITTPGNDYDPVRPESVDPNITNALAKGGESIIEKIFDATFGLLEAIIH